ncbi:Doubled CXXCH motif [Symmachiella macrocystis]|uniref:Doubled CXXCH motif n=1 Tax=Symmachiella macrocystis TaxID=2527985 RepID=A0A5C6B1V1_9PLAN|nr:cytochrome c3 family protein [Symmachiella macrocystis]TWU05216.1 Doubled CXXCH motif [Symmachiella macrocystis]
MTKGKYQRTQDNQSELPPPPIRWPLVIGLSLVLGIAVFVGVIVITSETGPPQRPNGAIARRLEFYNTSQAGKAPQKTPHITVWWDDIPALLRKATGQLENASSNIHPGDYVGPEACRECHKENYDSWSHHPHRWMNALADTSTVVGDFSGKSISYLGGKATFFKENGEYRMRLEREETQTYAIHQTIGSRFFQYYIGKQIDGPISTTQRTDQQELDHVLPLGYWIDPGEWVPIVHVGQHEELPDGQRMDPFDARSYQNNFSLYSDACDACHTTSPLGDLLSGNANQLAREVPGNIEWAVANYLAEERPHWLPPQHKSLPDAQAVGVLNSLDAIPASEHAVTLGISCESCHLGCREHAEHPEILPKFFPYSPHLLSGSVDKPTDLGRTHDNVNWACGRCHSGERPQFAGGMSTWNSTEFSDAMRGSCYSELKCIDCHNPHQAIGQKWTSTPAKDDARCIKCHQEYESEEAQAAHSHHQPGSKGSRCMNCHMPRINEGMQDVVRTHTIFSPTNTDMIQNNNPNACNQCHTDKSIDWTIDYLGKWYGSNFVANKRQAHSTSPAHSAALDWLQSKNEAVRLVAADSLFRTKSVWGQDTTIQDALINALDDPYLLNRQFARRGFEELLGVKLLDYGYRFYMMPEERKQPMAKLRQVLRAAFAESTPKKAE